MTPTEQRLRRHRESSRARRWATSSPPTVWAYIQRDDVSPQGWQVSFGAPLTEALPLVVTVEGTLHRELVQVFTYGAVVTDETGSAR